MYVCVRVYTRMLYVYVCGVYVCLCVYVRACMHMCVRVCVCVLLFDAPNIMLRDIFGELPILFNDKTAFTVADMNK